MAVNHWPYGPHIERDLAVEEVDWKSYFRMLKNQVCDIYHPDDFEDNDDLYRAHIETNIDCDFKNFDFKSALKMCKELACLEVRDNLDQKLINGACKLLRYHCQCHDFCFRDCTDCTTISQMKKCIKIIKKIEVPFRFGGYRSFEYKIFQNMKHENPTVLEMTESIDWWIDKMTVYDALEVCAKNGILESKYREKFPWTHFLLDVCFDVLAYECEDW